jgi:hypothetical protein
VAYGDQTYLDYDLFLCGLISQKFHRRPLGLRRAFAKLGVLGRHRKLNRLIPGQSFQFCFIKTLSETTRSPSSVGNFTADFQSSPVRGHNGHSIRRSMLTPNVFDNPG